MVKVNPYKVTTVPSTYNPNDLFFVAPAAKPDHIEIYLANSTGTQLKRVINHSDVEQLIGNNGGGFAQVEVVADIPARDALTLTANREVWVLDASADPTVDSGGAKYLYDFDNTTWIKTSEEESIDLVLRWSNLQGVPSELGKIGEDADGHLTYNGALPKIAWNNVEW